MTRRLVVALVVAVCGAACAPAAPAIAPRPAAPPTATEILQRVAAAYRGLASYADRGTVTSRARRGRFGVVASTHAFATAFQRGRGFRFEYSDGKRLGVAVWTDGDHARSTSWLAPGRVTEDDGLGRPLLEAYAPSSGTSLDIPRLLMPELTEVPLVPPDAAQLAGIEAVDGHACFHLRAQLGAAETDDLWIDRDSYLVRQLAMRSTGTADAPIDLQATTHVEPLANPPLTAAQLAGPDIGSARVEPRHVPVWLGVLFEPGGLRVRQTMVDSPAARAGLQPGDEIAAVGGVTVASVAAVQAQVATYSPGAHVVVAVKRAGQSLDVPVAIAERPDVEQVAHDQLVGKPAPPFSLPSATGGGPIALADLAGHVVVLDFWATWCGPCEAAIPELNGLHARHPGVRVVGISDEELDAIRAYLAAHHIEYEIAHDDQHAASDYMIEALPTTVIIDKHGVVREVAFGLGDYAALEAIIARLDAQP